MPSLFPHIEKLIPLVQAQLDSQRWSLIKGGQRSGKNWLAIEVARQFSRVYLFSPYSNSLGFSKVTRLPPSVIDGTENGVLVLIDEAMHMPGSYDVFDEARKYAPTLVLSSHGPEYDADLRWKLLPGFSMSTWDANPNLSYDNLLEAVRPESSLDYKCFIQDFGAF